MQTNEGPASLVELLAQEEELQFERFSNEDALAIGLQLVAAVRALGKSASVSIARGGQQLFQHAMTGTTPDHGDWIRRKENVVQRFGHSSYYVGMRHRIEGTRFEEQPGIDPAQYAAHGGCFSHPPARNGSDRNRDGLRPASSRRSRRRGGRLAGVSAGGHARLRSSWPTEVVILRAVAGSTRAVAGSTG